MSQIVPTDNNQPARIRTTYEKVVAHLSKPPFAYIAEQDGKVLEIDEKLGMVKIEYVDGSKFSLNFGKIITRYSAAGMYITQKVIVHSAVKSSMMFKKNEPIIFNSDFFMEDPFSNQLIYMLGRRVTVALMDTDGTIDDSNMISSKLSDILKFRPVHDRQIVLAKHNVIHSFVDIGTKVLPITPLMIFEEFDDMLGGDDKGYDEDTLRLIQQLNRVTPKAKTNGKVVDIKVLYTSPIESMHPSMQKFIRYVEQKSNKQVAFSKDTKNSLPSNEPITGVDKIGIVDVNEDTVIITYFIEDEYGAKHADKVVFSSAIKSEISAVYQDPIYTEDGMEIDAIFPGLSVYNRMVPESITYAAASLVLKRLQEKVLSILFDE